MYQQCQHIQWIPLGWLYEFAMLHAACFDLLTYPGSSPCQILAGKVSLILPVIDLRAHLHIVISDLVIPLIFDDLCPG